MAAIYVPVNITGLSGRWGRVPNLATTFSPGALVGGDGQTTTTTTGGARTIQRVAAAATEAVVAPRFVMTLPSYTNFDIIFAVAGKGYGVNAVSSAYDGVGAFAGLENNGTQVYGAGFDNSTARSAVSALMTYASGYAGASFQNQNVGSGFTGSNGGFYGTLWGRITRTGGGNMSIFASVDGINFDLVDTTLAASLTAPSGFSFGFVSGDGLGQRVPGRVAQAQLVHFERVV